MDNKTNKTNETLNLNNFELTDKELEKIAIVGGVDNGNKSESSKVYNQNRSLIITYFFGCK